MSLLKPKKSIEELEEDSEYLDAEIDNSKKRLIKKRIEEKLGSGGMGLFKSNGEGGGNAFQKAANWLRTH